MFASRSSDPTPIRSRFQAVSPQIRRVKGTITKVNPFSVFKMSLLFYASIMLVGLLVSMMLFWAARSVGIVTNIENLIRALGWTEFRFQGGSLMRFLLFFGVLQVAFWSSVNLLLTMLYNLVSDVIGGIELEVVEQEQ
ncbi:MAG TPA: DUF3566 domain-containing protein [Actinomycetota bacterium]|nr:DUF3566 domain-containing protein [Actinomycetota bacterium]